MQIMKCDRCGEYQEDVYLEVNIEWVYNEGKKNKLPTNVRSLEGNRELCNKCAKKLQKYFAANDNKDL